MPQLSEGPREDADRGIVVGTVIDFANSENQIFTA
jgi:hypothetical protein